MAPCSGIKRDGGRCKAQAIRGASYCVNHHPDYEDARRRRNSKGGKRGGRGRPQVELAAVKRELREVIEAVRDGSLDRGTGAVVGGLYNTLLRALETERRWHESDELEQRLSALEELAARERETLHSPTPRCGLSRQRDHLVCADTKGALLRVASEA